MTYGDPRTKLYKTAASDMVVKPRSLSVDRFGAGAHLQHQDSALRSSELETGAGKANL